MTLSIIIPVFNAETTIVKCIKSVIPTDETGDYEILLIDDGSQDNSLRICNELAKNNNHITSVS